MRRPKRPDRVAVFRAPKADWYWTVRSGSNGKIIGSSSEGYRRRGDCIANLERLTSARVSLVRFHHGIRAWGVLVR